MIISNFELVKYSHFLQKFGTAYKLYPWKKFKIYNKIIFFIFFQCAGKESYTNKVDFGWHIQAVLVKSQPAAKTDSITKMFFF